MDEENIRHLFQNIALGCVGTSPAGLAETVRDELPRMHAVQCGLQVVLSLYFHTVAEKCLKALSFGPAGMADHLRHLRALEQLLEQSPIGRLLQSGLEPVEEEIQELSGVLLDAGIDGRLKCVEQFPGHVVQPLRKEKIREERLQLVHEGRLRRGAHDGVSEGVDRVQDLQHRIHVARATQVVETHVQVPPRSLASVIRKVRKNGKQISGEKVLSGFALLIEEVY